MLLLTPEQKRRSTIDNAAKLLNSRNKLNNLKRFFFHLQLVLVHEPTDSVTLSDASRFIHNEIFSPRFLTHHERKLKTSYGKDELIKISILSCISEIA